MKYYKALLYGSIGSIVETSDLQRKSFNQAFIKSGLNWYWTKKEYKKLLNKSGGEDRISRYAKQSNITVNAKKIRSLKTKIFNNYLKRKELKLRPGIKDLINFCIKNKIKLGFVSSTSLNNINSIFYCLRRSIKKNYFNFIGNSSLVKKNKPNPDIYLFALKHLKLKPKECIAIEDSQESLDAAVKAKIKCLIFPGKFHSDKKFLRAYKTVFNLNIKIMRK